MLISIPYGRTHLSTRVPDSRVSGVLCSRLESYVPARGERELVEEELMLLRALEMRDDCFFHGSHPFNIVPIREYFAKKDDIILDIEMELREYEPQFLDSIWDRGRI